MNPPVLSIRDVSKEFGPGVRVLEHVDLEVVQGETLVLIGGKRIRQNDPAPDV